jgi:hypothetical protein
MVSGAGRWNCGGEKIDRRAGFAHTAGPMKTILLLSLLALAPLSSPVRAESLGEMAASAGVEWAMGKWASEDGNVSLSYTWRLEKHAIAVTFKMGEREAEGMMMLKPGTKDVIYGAVDNKGGLTTGKWIDFNGVPTLVTTHTDAEGNERKMAAQHIKTDADTLTVKISGVDSDGKPDESQSREVVFKRQK